MSEVLTEICPVPNADPVSAEEMQVWLKGEAGEYLRKGWWDTEMGGSALRGWRGRTSLCRRQFT